MPKLTPAKFTRHSPLGLEAKRNGTPLFHPHLPIPVLFLLSYLHGLLPKLFPPTGMLFLLTSESPNPASVTPTDPFEGNRFFRQELGHTHSFSCPLWWSPNPYLQPQTSLHPLNFTPGPQLFTQPTHTTTWMSNVHLECNNPKTNAWSCPTPGPNGEFPMSVDDNAIVPAAQAYNLGVSQDSSLLFKSCVWSLGKSWHLYLQNQSKIESLLTTPPFTILVWSCLITSGLLQWPFPWFLCSHLSPYSLFSLHIEQPACLR